jgi:hypothetical protein
MYENPLIDDPSIIVEFDTLHPAPIVHPAPITTFGPIIEVGSILAEASTMTLPLILSPLAKASTFDSLYDLRYKVCPER